MSFIRNAMQHIRYSIAQKLPTLGFHGRHISLGSLNISPDDGYIDIRLIIMPSETGYDYSKLYYVCEPEEAFQETSVLCFRMRHHSLEETHRFIIPATARTSGFIRLRMDALPYTRGHAKILAINIIPASDTSEESQRAQRLAFKQQTRKAVEASERQKLSNLPHMPESISLELTAGCNLTCGHCSSHGIPEAHALNNRRKAFDAAMLDRLAEDAFPALSLLTLVGRGEPMMVGKPLWDKLIHHLITYDVYMTCVTNGTFLRQRIDQSVLMAIDTITASIDGTTSDVFAANRGGASLENWLQNIRYYNDLRDRSNLARRPKLGLSWTLKRNNIHQFPDFIRLAIDLQADLLYVRHLFVFHEKDRTESLIGEPHLANQFLQQGYKLLRHHPIKLDAAPLAAT